MDELKRRKLKGTVKTLYQCFKTHEHNGDAAFYLRPELGWEMLEALEDLLGISAAGDEPATDEDTRSCAMSLLFGTLRCMRDSSPADGVSAATWAASADVLESMARARFGHEWERFKKVVEAQLEAHATSTD
jgi:hypothetical protein